MIPWFCNFFKLTTFYSLVDKMSLNEISSYSHKFEKNFILVIRDIHANLYPCLYY